jgi:predicted nuclease of predicted toxin-antitoxin system
MLHEYDIVADENVDVELIKNLNRAGLKIFSVLEKLPGVSDEEVLAIANSHQAIILTEEKDFGELTYRKKIHNYGIILIRLFNLTRKERIELISKMIILNFDKLKNNFTVFSNHGLRIKNI